MVALLGSDRRFSWWLMAGGGGTSKSRLALQFCSRNTACWLAGFLSEADFPWEQWRPKVPTLIVTDDAGGRPEDVDRIARLLHDKEEIIARKDQPELWEISFRDDPEPQALGFVHSDQPGMLEGLFDTGPHRCAAHVEFTRDGRHALVSIAEADGALLVYDAATCEIIKRLPMHKPSGKDNVYNKINLSSGTSH